jgi:dihydrodipicolinate synthase/N-acetylneuraminate lyase
MSSLSGVLPVVSTPFTSELIVDIDVLKRELDWLVGNGADGVVVAMVSELPRLTHAERRYLGEVTVEHMSGLGQTVLSVGAESTQEAVEYTRHAVRCGATGIMANPPLTVPVGGGQLLRYFRAILDAAEGLPTVIQDASGYIGQPIELSVLATLFDEYGPEVVLFKPEANPIGPRLSALHDLTGGQAGVFEGSGGGALLESFRRGVVGTMPGADLIWAISRLWRALNAGDMEHAYEITSALSPILAPLGSLDAYVAVEKYLLVKQGVFENELRRYPTNYELDDILKGEADQLFDRLVRVAGGPKILALDS